MIEQRVIPVIHILNTQQVKLNIEICLSLGINNVFLIDMQNGDNKPLYDIGKWAILKYGKQMKFGFNFLASEIPFNALQALPEGANALWTDNAHIDNQTLYMAKKLIVNKNGIIYFGGVDMKYQNPIPEQDYDWVIRSAPKYMDVLCTSGSATGKVASIEKVERIRKIIGNEMKLALASGISEDNINQYKEMVDYFLVATSITNQDEIIEKNKLERLLNQL